MAAPAPAPPPPTSLRVSGLYIYPVKSCRGVALNEAVVTPNGGGGVEGSGPGPDSYVLLA